MMVRVIYFDGSEAWLDEVKDIYNIKKASNVKELYLSDYDITSLPENIFIFVQFN